MTSRARVRQMAAFLAPGPFDIEAEGIRLRAYPADNHSDRVAMARGRLPDRDERDAVGKAWLLYTYPSPRDRTRARMSASA